jgi:inner membrane protease subunit 2
VERGDVVLYWKPHLPGVLGVKRIIGVEGDVIRRDPRRLPKGGKYGFGELPREIVVPPGQVFVEGDNWGDSLDSNDFGCVPVNLISGKAVGKWGGWQALFLGKWEDFRIADRPVGRWASRTRVVKRIEEVQDSLADWNDSGFVY